jgi:FMN-dependent NADH-azoreductase
MKTLVVKYLPRGERSHTKKLLDAFLDEVTGTEIVELDLCEDVPDLFLPDRLASYIHRNYLGEELSPEQAALMAKMDRMAQQLVDTDALVLATSMNNFSFPAVVKAWFDSVMLKGKTWDAGEDGFVGLMAGKRALMVMASGGIWKDELAYMEHGESLAKVEFAFMGYSPVDTVRADGMNMPNVDADAVVAERCLTVREIARTWAD